MDGLGKEEMKQECVAAHTAGGKIRMLQKFQFEETDLEGVLKITPFCAYDVRGYLIKDYAKEVFEQYGIAYNLEEVFYTNSKKGVIRALHFQREYGQPKLVRCVWGRIFDVVVDLRKGSKTYQKWLGFELNEENKTEVLIPAGCAHGYLVLEDSVVSYKCAEKFYGEYDDGILWDDPDLHIDWPLEQINGQTILADKDRHLQTFREFEERYGGL